MRPLDGHNGSRRVESSTTSATSNQETSLFKRATNVLRRYITSQFSERANYNVTIAGLDGSGKTTFLCLLKLGEVVQTTPTMNLNVETIEILTATSRVFKFTGWDVGAGSNDITAATIERHTVGGDAMIWFVDSSNQMRLSESVGEFTSTIRRVNSHRKLRVGTARKDYPILLLANKQDCPDAMSAIDLGQAFAKALSGRTASIFETSLIQSTNVQGGVGEALDWLLRALEEASARDKAAQAVMSQALNPLFQQVPNF